MWIWYAFVIAVGGSVGSFLNVVIHRLPRDQSLMRPPSTCPSCGKRIRPYDNIPLISWLLLRGKCRFCSAAISPRYFIIEMLTAAVFVGLFAIYFHTELRTGINLDGGGLYVYAVSVILLAGLIAASAIDLELWLIPLSICYAIVAVGLAGSTIAPYVMDLAHIRDFGLLPVATANQAAMAAGATVGMALSLLLLRLGVIKQSYADQSDEMIFDQEDDDTDHRLESLKEIVFLLPIVLLAAGAYYLTRQDAPLHEWWVDFSQRPALAGFFGSVWGYFIGCAIVWGTRIFGTLAFGKEAMGLGDVHLMGAAGTIIGWQFVLVAFFIAPFFGLAWAMVQMFFKKTRQIPYGPFLSLGILVVMILHNIIIQRIYLIMYHY